MPKFNGSYAYDIPCYFDFTVEAKSESEALRKAKRALKAGVFDNQVGHEDRSTENDPRVFIGGEAEADSHDETLEELCTDHARRRLNPQPTTKTTHAKS